MGEECDKDCKYNEDDGCSFGNSSPWADDNSSDCPLKDTDSKGDTDEWIKWSLGQWKR